MPFLVGKGPIWKRYFDGIILSELRSSASDRNTVLNCHLLRRMGQNSFT